MIASAATSDGQSDAETTVDSTLTITLVQMDVALGRPKDNFAHAATQIAAARKRDSNLVVLPELWSTGYDLENAGAHASVLTGRDRKMNWLSRFSALAKTNHLWLTGSLLEVQADGRIYNCMPLYNPSGALKAAYRKIHLFGLMEEDRYLAPGQDTALLDLPWGRVGLAICYDLRFPELFRRYALNGVHLIVIPAEWPSAREEHWRTLLRARAIENQCFIAACNRVGASKGTDFCGRSAVIDPLGQVLVEGDTDEELLTVTIDLSECAAARGQIPVFDDRRPELY